MNKICNFYINDTHLNITLFEYVKKQVQEGTKIIIVSQDNRKMGIKDIRNKFKKENIESKIDFLNEYSINKLYKNEKITIVIKGDNNFITKVEEDFSKLIKKEDMDIDILSCYDIKDINVENISNKYDQILNTKGISNLNNTNENNLQKI